MNVVPIGRLRHRLTIEQPVTTPDGAGGNTETWIVVADVWGRVEPLSGSERVEAGRLSGRHLHDITIRYRADIERNMRIRLGTRIFHILTLEDIGGRGRWLRMLAEERDL